jgi:hypothetical protein
VKLLELLLDAVKAVFTAMYVPVDQVGSGTATQCSTAGLNTVAPLLEACYDIQSRCAFNALHARYTASLETPAARSGSSSSGTGTSSSSTSDCTNDDRLISRVTEAVYGVHVVAGDLLYAVCKMLEQQVGSSSEQDQHQDQEQEQEQEQDQEQESASEDSNSDALSCMLENPIVQMTLLQQLAAYTMLLHEEHVSLVNAAEQQQQQQQQPASSQPAVSGQTSSSSSSQPAASQQCQARLAAAAAAASRGNQGTDNAASSASVQTSWMWLHST